MIRSDDSRRVLWFIAAMFVVSLGMIALIFATTRRPVVVLLPGGGDEVAGPEVPVRATADAGTSTSPAPAPPTVSVARIQNLPPATDPLDPKWEQISAYELPLDMQRTAEPMLTEKTVPNVKLQAAYNQTHFVWRLSWEQAEPSFRSNVSEFSDAVAVQFPLKDGAPFTMGGPGMPVSVMYWKALWQKDIDAGFQDVTDVYPNSWYDLYWFSKGTGPQRLATAFEDKASRPYMPGSAVGNPMSTVRRTQPVEELRAQGFGTSHHVPDSQVSGKGVWKTGRWFVVFSRPNNDVDPLIKRFLENPGQQLIALAVWDGKAQNRGGRKHTTNWIPMRIEK